GRWTSLNPGLTRTRLCRLDEYKADDHFDCEESRRTFFTTFVSASAGGCNGFDEFGQATKVTALVAGEAPQGALYGVAITASVGDVESFEMAPRPQPATRPEIPVLILE